ncbi:hypothetical protein RDWZM_007816 [Blomia tropicalis]|uniref:Uncharacterized protein n=1 Tax=Blomia tropicalis TaxID=40697 RepID=A0A9Q0M069_BLOTA|nr:hypothetical protein RDWZM_007816 [Blomia tropicalis]
MYVIYVYIINMMIKSIIDHLCRRSWTANSIELRLIPNKCGKGKNERKKERKKKRSI